MVIKRLQSINFKSLLNSNQNHVAQLAPFKIAAIFIKQDSFPA
jgi:hypothetical protein